MPGKAPLISLPSGFSIPVIGLGTFTSKDPVTLRVAISAAIDCGYRHFDTATIYANEELIGAALKEKLSAGGEVKREELFVTTKLWASSQHPQCVRAACEESLRKLQLDYVDLYLIHWPVPLPHPDGPVGAFSLEDTWKAMEALVDAGLVKSIGLSNCNKSQIDRIRAVATIAPSMLQIEASLVYLNEKLIKYAQSIDLPVTAYAPFGSPGTSPDFSNPLEIPCVLELAKTHGKSVGQILVRHALQRGIVVIPKSINPQRIHDNINVFDFELSPTEMDRLNLAEPNQTRRFGLRAWADKVEYPFHDEF